MVLIKDNKVLTMGSDNFTGRLGLGIDFLNKED